ncbi:unnamed protein product [Linum trigynum]|uniref:Reverse transcriptase domain-containing protein n=1 Tax=Linum trigynum TaxID=586398 RepID=A0AAV2CGP2_9ROSI
MNSFNSFIEDNDLLDLPISGCRFTWSLGANSNSQSRIDRILISPSFDTLYPDCRLLGLEKVESDHSPLLLLQWGGNKKLNRPWRFENMWLEDVRFFIGLTSWYSNSLQGSGAVFCFCMRLKDLKQNIKVWNRDVFGNIHIKVDRLLKEIKGLSLIKESRPLSDFEAEDLIEKILDLEKALSLQEISWRQKSREVWLKLGDQNSGFFHKMASFRRKMNFIWRIKINDTTVEGMDNIAQGVVEFYSNLFLEEYQTRPFPSNYNPPCLNSAESASLEKPFTEEEIWECLSDSDGTKAPGPDGFSFEFYKRCWNFVKTDVLNCFSEFFATGRLPKIATHSFICLVPKKGATEDIKDLRPIGLMGSVNKLICKVLSKRLGQVLPAVVSVSQHASVRGRQISEAGLIANELVDSRRRSKKPSLLIKLDIEKAFDNVSWSCLFTVLARLGFKEKWRQWILGAVCSPTISVLINGESKGFFTAHKGLRQGDPSSPGLFVLVMDILSFMLSKLKEDGKIKGFFMNEEEQRGEVTHLLFADDTLIFCDASPDQILHITVTLACFQAVTGLKINLDKTVIYTVGDVPEPEFFANILGCNWSSNPPKYLGYPLGAKLNVISFWYPILLNYKKKLESWSSRYLSAGGRLVLLKSVLSNLSGYYFSLFKAPKKVIEDMEKVQRKFLWSGFGDKRKTPLVEWRICKSNRNNGGLGIRDLATFNSAMLCKWLWKYGVNNNGWWRTLIDIKYSKGKSQWHTGGSRGGSSSSV